ncbi:hypothetical protein Ahy_A02g009273 isoform G [Arachis hypogaea]|uniref:Uncharacterized protein n=1 Tax=Arachis hypogaea TaxID=3818 RepID=A0A445EGI1_ARAHY|nr:hypothetical protein Ahy_A02g009273 isoform G [Arachis hypogaea]
MNRINMVHLRFFKNRRHRLPPSSWLRSFCPRVVGIRGIVFSGIVRDSWSE